MTLRFWQDFAAWVLMVVIIFAPWAFGSIPLWAESTLVFASLSASILYLVTRLCQKSLHFPHWIVFLAVLWLLGQGWWMTWNAQFILDPGTLYLLPITSHFPHLRGSLNYSASFQMMCRVSAFAGIFWMVFLLCRDSLWRKRIIYTIGVAAFSLLLFGIYQKISGIEGIWPQYGKNVWPFATYFYHGNAGAFINLTFPIVATLAWRAAFIDSIPVTRALWLSALVISVASAFVNSSKAALFIFLLLFFITSIQVLWFSRKIRIDWRSLSSLLIGMGIIVGAVVIVTLSGDTTQAIHRWTHAIDSRSTITTGRMGVAHILLQSAPAAGLWGLGPNSFNATFPYLARLLPAPSGHWQYAHEDYLQTLVEWGYLGTGAWALLFLGGFAVALWVIFFRRSSLRKRDLFLLCSIVLSVGGCAIHSLVDFPLQIPSLGFYVTILMGMMWSSPYWDKPSRAKSEPSSSE